MGMFLGHNQKGKQRAVYGYLYNWYAASDANMFPANCALPTSADFNTLVTYIGGATNNGGKLKQAGTSNWLTPNTGADNSTGFSALPGGGRNAVDGSFNAITVNALFIRSDNLSAQDYLRLAYNDDDCLTYNPSSNPKEGGSIRVIYTGSESIVTDYDGRIYDVITIGTQKWLKQNWACATLNNGTPIPNVTDGTTWAGLTTMARCAYNNDESYV